MSRKPNTLETLRMTLELLKRIPRTGKVSASKLHQQLSDVGLQRDLRTIQRQLDELSQHFDIDRDDSSKPYGYKWKENAEALSLPGLTTHESLMLALAEQHLANLLPPVVMRSMEGFFNQARTNLAPHTGAKSEREWLRKVRVVSTSQPLIPPKIKPGVFEAVSQALYANQWLEVDYVNAAGKKTTSRVMPLGLAQQGVRLFLVCRFLDYDNERSLALHRMDKAHVTGISFERPVGFDLKKYDDEGRFGFAHGKVIKLKMLISKEAGLHLLESPLSTDQTVRVLDDAYEIKATVAQTEQLKWWLRGFGSELKKVTPSQMLA